MDRSRLAIVVPAFNESATIAAVVAGALPYGVVIVVDDGSSDGTGALARAAGADVVASGGNQGYDGALNAGFAAADRSGCDAVVTLDADGEHDPQYLDTFRRKLVEERIPLVLGVRPHKQRFAETVMGAYIRARYGIRDILCGMKGYNIALYRENGGFDHHRSIGTELALNSVRRGHRFVEVNVAGRLRAGRPRFGSVISANMRIFRVLLDQIRTSNV